MLLVLWHRHLFLLCQRESQAVPSVGDRRPFADLPAGNDSRLRLSFRQQVDVKLFALGASQHVGFHNDYCCMLRCQAWLNSSLPPLSNSMVSLLPATHWAHHILGLGFVCPKLLHGCVLLHVIRCPGTSVGPTTVTGVSASLCSYSSSRMFAKAPRRLVKSSPARFKPVPCRSFLQVRLSSSSGLLATLSQAAVGGDAGRTSASSMSTFSPGPGNGSASCRISLFSFFLSDTA